MSLGKIIAGIIVSPLIVLTVWGTVKVLWGWIQMGDFLDAAEESVWATLGFSLFCGVIGAVIIVTLVKVIATNW